MYEFPACSESGARKVSSKTKISNIGAFIEVSPVRRGCHKRHTRAHQVNVGNGATFAEDFSNALTEAKNAGPCIFGKLHFVPFENCVFKPGPSSFYRSRNTEHFEGLGLLYPLKISSREQNFPTKVIMASRAGQCRESL